MHNHLPFVKMPLPWVLALVIVLALVLNVPIAQASKPVRDLSIVTRIWEVTPFGRSRRIVKSPVF
jgi:hypothetical protein